MKTFRDLSRLESVAHSPVMIHLSETLSGSSTIRNFGKEEDFIDEFYQKLKANMNADFWKLAVKRWFSVRLEITGKLIAIFSISLMVRIVYNKSS
jgi:ATP-binding cassette subfamily C (CFTR/MRP) protein 10